MIPPRWAQFVLLEENGKRPITKNWRSVRPSPDVVTQHGGNIGWVIPKTVLVVDCDHKNNGQQAYIRLQEERALPSQATVKTPNGTHTYLRLPPHVEQFPTKLREFPGIDFLTHGAYVLIPPSVVNDKPYEWVHAQFTMLSAPQALYQHGLHQQDDNDTSWAASQVDEETLKQWLEHIDPGIEYHHWIRIGFALYNWDKIKGLDFWIKWSRWQSTSHHKYKEGECESKWTGFRDKHETVTIATIKYLASESLVARVRERLTRPMTDTQKELYRTNIESTEILTHNDRVSLLEGLMTHNIPDDGIPPVFHEGVYDALAHVFLLKGYGPLTNEDFNRTFRGYSVPREKASDVVLRLGWVTQVWGRCYLPNDPRVVRIRRVPQVNVYDAASIPSISVPQIDSKYFERVHTHLRFLLGGDAVHDFFIDWLAHQVQHTGKKLTWAPFIQSVQGVGKTFLIRLLRSLLGDENVGVIRPTDVINRFNAWAVGSAVGVLDEIKIPRQNRDAIDSFLNKIISDIDVTIERKGQDVYSTMNTTNYLALTNHKNALHFRGYERRWWVILSPVKDVRTEIQEQFGIDHDTYFQKLHECLSFPGQLRRHFLEHPISEQFRRTIRAPITKDYERVVFEEKRLIAGYDDALDLLRENMPEYNAKFVLIKPFFEKLMLTMEEPYEMRTPYAKHRMLTELGYDSAIDRISLGKHRYSYAVKGRTTKEQIEKHWRELTRYPKEKGES